MYTTWPIYVPNLRTSLFGTGEKGKQWGPKQGEGQRLRSNEFKNQNFPKNCQCARKLFFSTPKLNERRKAFADCQCARSGAQPSSPSSGAWVPPPLLGVNCSPLAAKLSLVREWIGGLNAAQPTPQPERTKGATHLLGLEPDPALGFRCPAQTKGSLRARLKGRSSKQTFS